MAVTTVTPNRSEPREALITLSASVWLLATLAIMLLGAAVGFFTSNFLFVYTVIGLALACGFAVSAFLPADPPTKPVGKSARKTTEPLAVVALVSACAIVLPFVAVPFGHLARRQIVRSGGRGDGLALAALIIGYAEVFLAVAVPLWFWNLAEQVG